MLQQSGSRQLTPPLCGGAACGDTGPANAKVVGSRGDLHLRDFRRGDVLELEDVGVRTNGNLCGLCFSCHARQCHQYSYSCRPLDARNGNIYGAHCCSPVRNRERAVRRWGLSCRDVTEQVHRWISRGRVDFDRGAGRGVESRGCAIDTFLVPDCGRDSLHDLQSGRLSRDCIRVNGERDRCAFLALRAERGQCLRVGVFLVGARFIRLHHC